MIKRIYTEEQKKHNCERQYRLRKENPEKYRLMGRKSEHKRRLKRYGLTEESYNDLLILQSNTCAICGIILMVGKQTHVYHCHITGKVRGILCHHCNLLLGNAKDSILTLQKASAYLEKSL